MRLLLFSIFLILCDIRMTMANVGTLKQQNCRHSFGLNTNNASNQTKGTIRSMPVETDIFPKNCGHQNVIAGTRIIGGSEAALGEFPWMARLIHKNRIVECSGFLIHPKYVLTAAHCLSSSKIENEIGPVLEVQFGEHNTETETDCDSGGTICTDKPLKRRVLKIIVHPKYITNSKQFHYDIGLISLKSSVKLTQYISPICLLQDKEFNAMEYWISGWGKTENARNSTIKRKVSIPPFSWDDCVSKFDDIDLIITKKQICAGGMEGKDGCNGDSGGPLMVLAPNNTWYAAGIMSYGYECGKKNWPGVYTKIISHLNWIRRKIIQEESMRSH